MLKTRINVTLLSLLATMLVSTAFAVSASANAGPFWHHRAIGGEGEGSKVESKAPENFKGKGGEQTLKGTVGTTPIEIRSKETEVKGAAFNLTNQGQIKLSITYIEPKLIEPKLAGCEVKIGTNNTVVVKGHLAWKWNGTAEQLENTKTQREYGQTPDLIFTPREALGTSGSTVSLTTTANAGNFTTITFTPTANCGATAGTFTVGGAEVGFPNRKLEEFSRTLSVFTTSNGQTPFRQHVWAGGPNFVGLELALSFAGNPANLIGQNEVESEQQELAVFEK